MPIKRNWNAIAARAAEYLTHNPGANKEALYGYIRMRADGCSLSNCALACTHLMGALVVRRSTTGTSLSHWIDGSKLPEAVISELISDVAAKVLASRAPDV